MWHVAVASIGETRSSDLRLALRAVHVIQCQLSKRRACRKTCNKFRTPPVRRPPPPVEKKKKKKGGGGGGEGVVTLNV